jgi:ribonuclease P protein component
MIGQDFAMITPTRYTLPRSHRLKGRNVFRPVYDARTRVSRGPLTAYARQAGLGHARLGISIGRKVGNAVVRNRIKRRLREAFRLNRHRWGVSCDLVLVVRPHAPLSTAAYQSLLDAIVPRLTEMLANRS